MENSEIDRLKDIVQLQETIDLIILMLNNKGYDLKLIDNRDQIDEQTKIDEFKDKYPEVAEVVVELIMSQHEENHLINNNWIIYFQSENDGYVNYANTKEKVRKLIQEAINEHSDFNVYEIYHNYKPVDFEVITSIFISDVTEEERKFTITSFEEYDRIRKLKDALKMLINKRDKITRYLLLENRIKEFDDKLSIESTNLIYYVLENGNYIVKGKTLIDLANEFAKYVEEKLEIYLIDKEIHNG